VQHALSAYSVLNRLMKLPVDRPAGRSYLHRPELAGRIEFNQAGFVYPNQKVAVLQDVTAAIAPGEKVAVLGRVGAGKTTLLKLAAGLYAPTSGAILVDGADLQQIDPADLRRNLGYVSQDARLFSGTLRQNIAMGAPLADDEAILAVSRIAGLDRWVGSHPLGFDMPIGEQGEGISGGQRQAVAIARALLQGPPMLVMDEPTSSMDHNTEEVLIRYLKTFCAGRTLLLATHKPSLLALVDRLIVLDGGRVVADGPRDVVLKALARPQEAHP
jgi:ATP-binding cassette subfamily C protein LapB